ncbi:MAG: sigma 54-interacting transcriptional regulator [Syntrophobacteraceae bacterium]|jgi:PAS domain S-box-containing protein
MLRKENLHPGTRDAETLGQLVRREEDLSGEYLRFERLISDLSARFVSIVSDQIDAEIELALEHVLEFFQVDRCALLGLSPDLKRVHVTHAAYAEGIERVPGDIELANLFPWTYERLVLQRQRTRIDRLEQLPEGAGQDRSNCIAMGIRSYLNIPLFFEGRVSSIFVLNAVREELSWPEEYIPRLRLLGEIFINALERRKAYLVLRESEARLTLEADASGAMLWNLDVGSGHIWTTHKAKAFLGFAPDSDMNLESFLCVVHPEDREDFHESVEVTIQSGSDISAEYRIVRPDGSIRWLLSKGRLYKATPGSAACLMGVSIDITERKQAEEEIRKSYDEISRLKDKLEAENTYLRSEVSTGSHEKTIIGRSDPIKYVLYRISEVAPMNTTVLISGETGTGKGLVAAAVHEGSLRKDRPMIHVNCAVLPANLIESELFGREKGAFTGAQARQIGRFELADKGTIFLDEIAELPVELQAKLLRVIDNGELERLGDPHTIKVDVRIIASTNRYFDEEIRKGRFREDLFYRLNVFPITVPRLRERTEDIPLIVDALIGRLNKQLGRRISTVTQEVMRSFQSYHWPGNVRELENIVERAVIMSRGPVLELAEQLGAVLPPTAEVRETTHSCLADVERSHIQKTLEALKWKIEGPNGAAHALGLKPSTLRSRMEKLNISRPEIF